MKDSKIDLLNGQFETSYKDRVSLNGRSTWDVPTKQTKRAALSLLVNGDVRRNRVIVLNNLYLVALRDFPGLPLGHLWDELQLVLRLHN